MKNKDFTQIPNFLIKDKKLSDPEFRTYALLKSYKYGDKGNVFPSQATLAEVRGKSRKSIIGHIHSLKAKGIIDFKRRGYSQSNLYRFISEENYTSNVKESSPEKLQNLHTKNTESNNTEFKNISGDVSYKKEKELSEEELDLVEKIVKWNTRPVFNTLLPKYAVRLQITHVIQKYGYEKIYKIWDGYAVKAYSPHPKGFWNAIKKLKEDNNVIS